MSWLRELNRIYQSSPYRCRARHVTLDESPACAANFESMASDALILQFEKMVDDRDEAAGGAMRAKCDLVALQGDEFCVDIVLVEVKAGVSQRRRTIRSHFSRARQQLIESVSIVHEAIQSCTIRLPNRRIGYAVVVLDGAQQESIARDVLSNVNVDFRRKTGFRLFIARCNDDIGELLRPMAG